MAHNYTFDDIKIGMHASITRQVTEDDIVQFANLTGDKNPVHLDREYAKKTVFKGRVAHGMLTASYISSVLGTKLPGYGAIYISQSLRFKKPVYIDDEVTARIEVIEILPSKKFVTFKTECFVQDNLVLEGEATIMMW
jgi:3-hydroxybutyryl-CoA dehydratase